MRDEPRGLVLALLIAAGAARAQPAVQPGAWFPPSPCDASADLPLPAGEALLSVHDRPDSPPRDALLRRAGDGHWSVRLEDWSRWTAQPPPAVDVDAEGERMVPLARSDALAFRIDACTSELWIDADPARMQTLNPQRPGAGTAISVAGYGGFLNFDADYGGIAGNGAYSTLFDLGLFAPAGAARSAAFLTRDGARRLGTVLFHDDPEHALRLRLGDSISDSAEWESAVRFGGIQWGADFALQPERIIFPLPNIAGSAALASTAQLYMNGQRLSEQNVQPGQFRFDSVPVLTGAGNLSVVVRDALGREQTVVQPFYVSPRLLAKGLDAYTFEGGFLRENYAARDDRYTRPFAALTLARGLSYELTARLRGVGGDRRQLGGAELDWIAGSLGLVTVSGGVSRSHAGPGAVATLAFERSAERLSFSLRRRFATSSYADLGRNPGTLHFSDAARISYNADRAGNASLVYISEQPWHGVGTRLAGLAYSIQPLRGVQVYASWLHPVDGRGSDSIVVGISVNLDRGSSGGLQWTHDSGANGARVFFQHSPSGPLGWSYSAAADAQREGLRQAGLALATERGTLGAGYASLGGRGAPSATAQTGLAVLDGHGYWTRPVQSSFAVVDAGQVPGVRVYRENQFVGTTDAQGRLLVPDLQPFQANHLGIDDRDLPIGLGLSDAASTIAPPADAGVPVHFGVDAQMLTQLRLIDAAGVAVPAGAALSLDGESLPLLLGYDGLVYAKIGEGAHELSAQWSGGSCRAALGARSAGPSLRCTAP